MTTTANRLRHGADHWCYKFLVGAATAAVNAAPPPLKSTISRDFGVLCHSITSDGQTPTVNRCANCPPPDTHVAVKRTTAALATRPPSFSLAATTDHPISDRLSDTSPTLQTRTLHRPKHHHGSPRPSRQLMKSVRIIRMLNSFFL